MDFDDIVVGSGLTALATAIGLDARRRILVLSGPKEGVTHYYDGTRTVPRAHDGFGGLGRFWHGVISAHARAAYARAAADDVRALFTYFYPQSRYDRKFGEPWLFVPRKPIRPSVEWARLAEARGDRLRLVPSDAERIEIGAGAVTVTAAGQVARAARLWIAAGTLRTPALLEAMLNMKLARSHVSDHVISYLGQIDRGRHPDFVPPTIDRTPEGFWQKAYVDGSGHDHALLMAKPARFGYRRLDYGIEQRAAFGLPTGGAVAKIVRAQSPGLFSEALFNRFGLFPNARILSLYAQVVVPDMHAMVPGADRLETSSDAVLRAIAAVRPFNGKLVRSERPDLFVKAIHLHHSVDLDALAGSGLSEMPVRIVDPSILADIGPEHHSFFTMARARGLARSAG